MLNIYFFAKTWTEGYVCVVIVSQRSPLSNIRIHDHTVLSDTFGADFGTIAFDNSCECVFVSLHSHSPTHRETLTNRTG